MSRPARETGRKARSEPDGTRPRPHQCSTPLGLGVQEGGRRDAEGAIALRAMWRGGTAGASQAPTRARPGPLHSSPGGTKSISLHSHPIQSTLVSNQGSPKVHPVVLYLDLDHLALAPAERGLALRSSGLNPGRESGRASTPSRTRAPPRVTPHLIAPRR